jgi:hypothetical protein
MKPKDFKVTGWGNEQITLDCPHRHCGWIKEYEATPTLRQLTKAARKHLNDDTYDHGPPPPPVGPVYQTSGTSTVRVGLTLPDLPSAFGPPTHQAAAEQRLAIRKAQP